MIKIFGRANEIKTCVPRSVRHYSRGSCQRPPKHEYECVLVKTTESRGGQLRNEFQPSDGSPNYENIWKKIFLCVCVPSLIGATANVIYRHEPHKRPPYVEYSYMRILNTDFPWRDGKTPLFYNPRVNARPGGYEFDDENDK